jgi:hypothetical protein
MLDTLVRAHKLDKAKNDSKLKAGNGIVDVSSQPFIEFMSLMLANITDILQDKLKISLSL